MMGKYDLVPRKEKCPQCGRSWHRYPFGDCLCQKQKFTEKELDHQSRMCYFKSQMCDINREMENEASRIEQWKTRKPYLERVKKSLKHDAEMYLKEYYAKKDITT